MSTTPQVRTRYDAATAGISAYAIIEDGTLVGRLVVRRRATSSGHCVRAWFHLFGHPMFEGRAIGGGYDMASAAIHSAVRSAWQALHVPDRAKMKPFLAALESRDLPERLDSSPLQFIRAI